MTAATQNHTGGLLWQHVPGDQILKTLTSFSVHITYLFIKMMVKQRGPCCCSGFTGSGAGWLLFPEYFQYLLIESLIFILNLFEQHSK